MTASVSLGSDCATYLFALIVLNYGLIFYAHAIRSEILMDLQQSGKAYFAFVLCLASF